MLPTERKKVNKIIAQNIEEYALFDEINIEDRLFVSWKMFEEAVSHLFQAIGEIQEKEGRTFDAIFAIPKGGLCLGVKLAYLTGLPLITSPERLTRDTLVVDDCTRSGKTLSKYKEMVTLTMFHSPNSNFKPTAYYKEASEQINFCWEAKHERN